jgi:hypothetical protein
VEDQRFWEIIAQTKPGKGSLERQTARLTKALSKLGLDEVVDFDQAFVEANRRLYTWDHWGAAELLFGGCGDDHFTDFRSWVIAQGRDVYEAFLADPDSIAAVGRIDDDEVGDAELFSYAASEVYEDATGEEIDVALPEIDIVEPLEEPTGEPLAEDDREGYRRRYPRLFEAHVEQREGRRR